MAHPGQDPQEPPTTPEPWAGGQPPVFSPGSAAVPQPPPAASPEPSWPPAATQSYPAPPYQPGYGPYPGGMPQAGPPKSRTGLIVGLVVVIVLLLVGGAVTAGFLFLTPAGNRSVDSGTASRTPGPDGTSATAGPATTAPKTSAPAARFTGDLRTLLVPRPAGAKPLPQFADNDGKLDDLNETLEMFEEGTEAWRRMLQTNNYQRGAVMQWFTDKSLTRVFLFQFSSPADAVGFQSTLENLGIQGHSVEGEVGGIQDSLLFVQSAAQGGRTTYTLSVRGDIAIYIGMLHPGKADLAVTAALAVTQHERVPDL